MGKPSAEDVQRALQNLSEGIPGRNEARPSGTGELDNPEVRHLLAGAAFIAVLGSDAREAYDALGQYLEESQTIAWFGQRRAALIVEMLLYQTGWSMYSTWNSLREQEIQESGTRPDPRWAAVCSRVKRDRSELSGLAAALAERLSAAPTG